MRHSIGHDLHCDDQRGEVSGRDVHPAAVHTGGHEERDRQGNRDVHFEPSELEPNRLRDQLFGRLQLGDGGDSRASVRRLFCSLARMRRRIRLDLCRDDAVG